MKYLIIGLGNIGIEYDNTRHNIGFDIADEIAKQQGVSFELKRLAFYTHYRYKGRKVHLIKPTTFMNLSGKAVQYWMNELKISEENILVLVDDIALPYGKIRLKPKGSDAGHNGLKNIQATLGHNKYPRLKFGIGDNYRKGRQVDYVLGQWNSDEKEALASYIEEAIKAVNDFVFQGIARAMNLNN